MVLHFKKRLVISLSVLIVLITITNQATGSNETNEIINNALNGSTDAQNKLGEIYIEGDGVLQDYAKAYAWYRVMVLFGDKPSSKRINNLQQKMSDDEMLDALKEYNNIYYKIIEKNKNTNFTKNRNVINCDIAKYRMISLERLDGKNLGSNNTSNYCTLAQNSLIIWEEIQNIISQCPELDINGVESQYAKETIEWAFETKIRTCGS